jgi:hypothetical protein
MDRHRNRSVLQSLIKGKLRTFHILVNENLGLEMYYNINPVKLSSSRQEMFFSQYIFRT